MRAPEVEAFWDLPLDAHERDAVSAFVRVLGSLEQSLEALGAATATTAMVSRHIADKRDVRTPETLIVYATDTSDADVVCASVDRVLS